MAHIDIFDTQPERPTDPHTLRAKRTMAVGMVAASVAAGGILSISNGDHSDRRAGVLFECGGDENPVTAEQDDTFSELIREHIELPEGITESDLKLIENQLDTGYESDNGPIAILDAQTVDPASISIMAGKTYTLVSECN